MDHADVGTRIISDDHVMARREGASQPAGLHDQSRHRARQMIANAGQRFSAAATSAHDRCPCPVEHMAVAVTNSGPGAVTNTAEVMLAAEPRKHLGVPVKVVVAVEWLVAKAREVSGTALSAVL